jgi:hypothetical protein
MDDTTPQPPDSPALPAVSSKQQGFSDEQRENILKALVLANMQPKIAKARLEREGMVVAMNTLRQYKSKYAQRLEELGQQREWVAKGQAEDFEEITSELTTLAKMTAQKIAERQDWDEMNIASLGKLITSLMTGAGIATDKARILRDMPTVITESRDISSLLKSLERFGNVVNVNPDLITAEVVEETPAPALPLPDSEAA